MTHGRTHKCKSSADPTRGGSAKNPRNVTKKYQRDISSRLNNSKQFGQLFTDTQTHTDGRTNVNLELTPPEVGQLKTFQHFPPYLIEEFRHLCFFPSSAIPHLTGIQ